MSEMMKLEKMLNEANVPHRVMENWCGAMQIWYPSKENPVSDAICQEGSYGYEDGLLEIMGLASERLRAEWNEEDAVEGWLTAEEVFDRWRAHYESTKK